MPKRARPPRVQQHRPSRNRNDHRSAKQANAPAAPATSEANPAPPNDLPTEYAAVSTDIFVPQTEAELADYTKGYFARLEEFERQLASGSKDDDLIVSDLVSDLVYDGRSEEAWRIVLALVNAAPTPRTLGFVAAADLEDLVQWHARMSDGWRTVSDDLYRRIVAEARANPRLREAFGLIYWDGEPDWFRSEIAALGVTIA